MPLPAFACSSWGANEGTRPRAHKAMRHGPRELTTVEAAVQLPCTQRSAVLLTHTPPKRVRAGQHAGTEHNFNAIEEHNTNDSPTRPCDISPSGCGLASEVMPCRMEAPQPRQNTQAAAGQVGGQATARRQWLDCGAAGTGQCWQGACMQGGALQLRLRLPKHGLRSRHACENHGRTLSPHLR